MKLLEFEKMYPQRHGDGKLQTAIPLLVYSNAPVDFDQAYVFGSGVTETARSQTLPAHMGNAPQTS